MILPVIMAGGSGSRLWPLSRTHYPKQFIPLVNNDSMLQNTLTRLDSLSKAEPIVICNNEHRFMVAEQLRNIDIDNASIILEPVGRNTAPAIALAAFKAIKDGNDPMLLVLAADHVIMNEQSFIESINKAKEAANDGMLVTFGIVPTHPETGYGYIKQGKQLGSSLYQVEAFVEKPDLKTAESYLSSKSYCWNSGMFLFKASTYLNELKKFNSEIYDICQSAIESTYSDLDFIRIPKDIFEKCPDDSIDYAVMECTDKAIVVPMDAGWSDVGSWSALWDVQNKDDFGNACRGDVILDSTTNSYIYAQNKLVSTVGVSDLVIVETKDAVLVAHKDKVQNVKNIVTQLKELGRNEYQQHLDVYRPWGKHEQIAEGERYHVKKVTVRPGEKTATQIHYHRAEHWIVVSGTAKVLNGGDEYLVSENQSTYIPIGSPHSFENPGKFNLELVEVRTGNYLSEDDIVRIGNEGEGY
ncbi:mannose-1-phosphate guanylyltransferase/mannose-6-phosphate isomerase [Photobacterium damselae]|uniref:Mannose-1-phosphate guanylyltransferase/mannose-6-phosphate isomerase n=1 Tax=Photobacterium damselae TaxID=38293 RepID=A0ACD3SX81_PHODM|nr:mannose-1-phosphate guanylyltransferase/mannose-6-phosphate isomerase [Photobacterium damselae]RDL31283.1 mannose-1-phosphate guanylyltransferase/mannose-6-phosphate isomerase [Photobacterium damselae]TMX50474.1 mannose-1-phosphate guanylyltransferase/mannose-6-phosphate isomerase [Photobacterium damselae]TMX63727.1 mannose-1-phosphate guanylyltransferase/mannose-6-phosphate isomerase [Photobacterium damselae]TMX70283.1 mannose-1-phosphate guanylyltransferase/mannose-6-phosphate isomerase [P